MLEFLGKLLSPLFGSIDKLDISGNEKLKLKNEIAKVESEITTRLIEVEKIRLEMHAKLVAAEAASPHKINAIWRPIASLVLVSIACISAFDIIHPNEQFWQLLQLVLGGHIITSSGTSGIANIAKVISGIKK